MTARFFLGAFLDPKGRFIKGTEPQTLTTGDLTDVDVLVALEEWRDSLTAPWGLPEGAAFHVWERHPGGFHWHSEIELAWGKGKVQ